LVETGTFKGDMVEAQKRVFDEIYSIELSRELFEDAKRRFAFERNVHILHGDSGVLLHTLVKGLKGPAIFWLDGHYSDETTAMGNVECPVLNELEAILNTDWNHIILIDDARDFNGTHDYPSVEELRKYVESKTRDYVVQEKHGILRVVPKSTKPTVF
jgi:hypothetical protein